MRNARAFVLVAILAGSAHGAAADPVMGHVVTAPTAWLPPSGAIVGTLGSDHRGAGTFDLGIGLGGIASLDLGLDTDVRGCTACDPVDGDAAPLWMGRAAFRLGARQDAWFRGMPALVLGIRNTFAAHGHTFGAARSTDAYVVASRSLGPVRIHGGLQVTEAAYGARTAHLSPTLSPLLGLEWTPGIYPRSTMLFDLVRMPRLEPDAVRMEWMGDLGVRYQAFWWGSIDLAVRYREDQNLSQSAVLVRLNGVFVPRSTRDREAKKKR